MSIYKEMEIPRHLHTIWTLLDWSWSGKVGSVVTDTDASFSKPGIWYTLINTFHYPFCLFYLLTKGNIKKEKSFLMLGYSSSGFLSQYFAHFSIAQPSMPMFACVYSYVQSLHIHRYVQWCAGVWYVCVSAPMNVYTMMCMCVSMLYLCLCVCLYPWMCSM